MGEFIIHRRSPEDRVARQQARDDETREVAFLIHKRRELKAGILPSDPEFPYAQGRVAFDAQAAEQEFLTGKPPHVVAERDWGIAQSIIRSPYKDDLKRQLSEEIIGLKGLE